VNAACSCGACQTVGTVWQAPLAIDLVDLAGRFTRCLGTKRRDRTTSGAAAPPHSRRGFALPDQPPGWDPLSSDRPPPHPTARKRDLSETEECAVSGRSPAGCRNLSAPGSGQKSGIAWPTPRTPTARKRDLSETEESPVLGRSPADGPRRASRSRACVGSRDSAPSAIPPQRIPL